MLSRALPVLLLSLAACRSPVRQQFAVSTDAPSRTALVPLADGVLVANEGGRLLRIDTSGQVTWEVDLQREIVAAPAVAGAVVVAATVAGEWVGVGLGDGEVVWIQSDGEPQRLALAAAGDRVFVLSPRGEVRALHAPSGGTAWTVVPGPGATTPTLPPVVCGGLLLVVRDGATVEALGLADGEARWKASTGPLVGLGCVDGQAVLSEAGGALRALELGGGLERWSRKVAGALLGPAVALGANLWVQSGARELVGVARSGEGDVLEVPSPIALGAEPAPGDGVLVLVDAERTGWVVGLEVPSAKERFRIRVDGLIRVPAVVQGDAVWVLPRDGRVMGLRVRPGR